jgi:prepilin-type N-terminal cleavage/methylation domain-containing protein
VRSAGFTLIEMLIVVAIVLVLCAIAIPGVLSSRVAAQEASAIEDIHAAQSERGDRVGAPFNCPSPPDRFSTTKSGYIRGCTVGVYWATPAVQGKTGVRGFGGDYTGRICFTTDGTIPNMAGHCQVLK